MCTSENTKSSKVAALAAYRCFIVAISRGKALQILAHSFSNILKFLEDPVICIRHECAKTLIAIAESRHQIFLQDEVLPNHYNMIVSCISDSDDERLSELICIMIEKLAISVGNESENEKGLIVLGSFLDNLSGVLIEAAFKKTNDENTHGISEWACRTLTSLSVWVYSQQEKLLAINQFLMFMEKASEVLPKMRSGLVIKELMNAAGMTLGKLRGRGVEMDKTILLKLFSLAVRYNLCFETMSNECIHLMTIVGICFGRDFESLVEVYEDHVRKGISDSQNSSGDMIFLCIAKIEIENPCIMRNDFLKLVIFPEIMKRMQNETIPLEERSNLFSIFGELCSSRQAGSIILTETPMILASALEILQSSVRLMQDKVTKDISHYTIPRISSCISSISTSLQSFSKSLDSMDPLLQGMRLILSYTFENMSEMSDNTTVTIINNRWALQT